LLCVGPRKALGSKVAHIPRPRGCTLLLAVLQQAVVVASMISDLYHCWLFWSDLKPVCTAVLTCRAAVRQEDGAARRHPFNEKGIGLDHRLARVTDGARLRLGAMATATEVAAAGEAAAR
jgi:hypothetical protein